MPRRWNSGLAPLLAAPLLLAACSPRGDAGQTARPDGDGTASFRSLGVRLPAGRTAGPRADGAFGFGPLAPEGDSSGPVQEALQALVDGRLDAAVLRLERALEERPDDPDLRAGLAAAFLARGLDAERGTPSDLVEALERIGRRPTDPSSIFNRALALEALYCYRLAARAWERYLEVDPGSEWGALARERLEAARETLARLEAGPDEGDEVGSEEEGTAPATAGPEHAAAVRDLQEGLLALEAFRIDVAAESLERSLPALEAAGDPHRWEAEEGLARVEYNRKLYERSEARAIRVLAAARNIGNTELENRALWLLANLNLGRLHLQRALDHARQRLELGHRRGDRRMAASAEYTISRILDEMGEPEDAWSHRLASLRGLAEVGDGYNLALSIHNSSFALARQERYSAAADFVSEMLEIDRTAGDALGIAESLWMRSSHLVRAGDAAGASADVAEATSWLPEIEDDGTRAYLASRLRAVEGRLLVVPDPDEAARVFSRSLQALQGTESEYGEAELLLERARALRLAGRLDEAGRDLEEAVRLVSSQRSRIGQPLLRVSFFDLQSELADEALAVSVARGEEAEAFRLAESMKGVLLRETLGSADDPHAAGGSRALDRRPEPGFGDVLVSYWSLPDELLIWAIRGDAPPALHRGPVSREALSDLVRRLGEHREAGRASGSLSAEAHRLLLAPVAEHLTGARRLIVVPDRVTRGVPWPALRNSAEGTEVLERFVVRVQPTALSAGFRTGGSAAPLTTGHLLALGDPWTDGELPALPGARAEVAEVARRFSRATVLVGREATRARLLEELPRADVVQVASHFTTGEAPWSTRIALASERVGGASGLTVGEIAGLDLRGTRLVVLSGCATGREGAASLEGTFAAAGAFLAAGAREVVSTLWPVDDRTTLELMGELYDRLEEGYATDDALREAQRALAESEGSAARSADWAAFQVLSIEPHAGVAPTTGGGES